MVVEYRSEWDAVPVVDDTAVVDEHWQELRSDRMNGLPESYMPTAMSTRQIPPQARIMVWVLVVMLISATASGICLTYGPAELFSFLRK